MFFGRERLWWTGTGGKGISHDLKKESKGDETMTEYGAYMGKVLMIDLRTHAVSEYPGPMKTATAPSAARSWQAISCSVTSVPE